MVERVETDIPHSPQNAREAAEKAVAAEQLAQATALLNDRITKISNDPSISPDDKRKLIDQLNGVKGTTNINAIYSVMQEVSAQAATAEANTNYEVAGNAMQVQHQSLYTGSFNISTAKGRYAFASSLAGPNAPKEVVEIIAHNVETDPQLHAAAQKWAAMTPEQREAHKAARDERAQETAATVQQLEAKPDISASDRRALRQLATKPYAGRAAAAEAVQDFQETGNSAALQSAAADLHQDFEARRARDTQYARSRGFRNPEAYGAAAATDEFNFLGLQEESHQRMRSNIRSNSAEAQAEAMRDGQAFISMVHGTNEARVDAYVTAYNQSHKGQQVDQAALKAAAVKYVEEHASQSTPFTRGDVRAVHSAVAHMAASGDKEAAKAFAENMANNVSKLMEMSGYSSAAIKAAHASIMVDAAVQNTKTALTTTIDGAWGIVTGDSKAIDTKGRGVGIMTKKVASAVGFDAEHAQQIGHAATELAQTAGHKISGAIQTGEHALGAVATAGSDLMSWGAAKLGMGSAHAATPAKPNPQAELQAVRRAADTNHDGKLSGAEVSAYLNAHGAVHKDAHKPVTNAELVAASHHRPTPQQATANVNAQFAAAEAKFGLDPHQAHSLAEIKKAMHDHGVKDADINKMLEGGLSKGEVIAAAQHLPSHKPAPHAKAAAHH